MSRNNELAQRIGVAALGIPAAVAALYAGGWILSAVLALVAVIGALEFFNMARHTGTHPLAFLGALGAACFVLVGGFERAFAGAGLWLWVLTILMLIVTAAVAIWVRGVAGRPFAASAATVVGALFTGGTLIHAVLLRHLLETGIVPGVDAGRWRGVALVGFPIALTWINDSAAFFVGRALGKRKLIPAVSPGKTVEGALAGLSFTVIAGILYSLLILGVASGLPLGVWEGAVGGALVAVAAQLGDLAESLFKREAGVKDSGRIFPGHGGVLDRFDALFFTLPIAFWFLGGVLWLKGGGGWQ